MRVHSGHHSKKQGAEPPVFCCKGLCGKGEAGFTLTELVVTIVIIGILAAMAVPRFANNNEFQNRAAADQIKAVLRYAQKVAIASHAPVIVNLLNGDPQNCSTTVVAGVINCVLPNSVDLNGAPPISFDAMGRPVPPNVPISINVGGIPITIEAETGYVH